jgi:hypothetical protein
VSSAGGAVRSAGSSVPCAGGSVLSAGGFLRPDSLHRQDVRRLPDYPASMSLTRVFSFQLIDVRLFVQLSSTEVKKQQM